MGTVPGSGMVLGADVGCLLGKSGRDNQAQIPALVREREKEGEKKKEKEAKKKKKEIELYNASFCNGGSGVSMKD